MSAPLARGRAVEARTLKYIVHCVTGLATAREYAGI